MSTESKLWPALIRARQAIQPIGKSATNPHFKNKYAPLGEVLASVLPALHAEGLALAGFVDRIGPDACCSLVVRITHSESGETINSYVPLVGGTDMQKLGGAMTYAMRYAIGMLLALELEDDDDGQRASQPVQRQQQAPALEAQVRSGARPATPPRMPQVQSPPRSVAPTPLPVYKAPEGKGGKVFKGQECPSCHKLAVIKGKVEFGGGWLCWKGKDGCGAKYTDGVWSMVGSDGPSSLDPPPPMDRHEAPADIQSLTDEADLPF